MNGPACCLFGIFFSIFGQVASAQRIRVRPRPKIRIFLFFIQTPLDEPYEISTAGISRAGELPDGKILLVAAARRDAQDLMAIVASTSSDGGYMEFAGRSSCDHKQECLDPNIVVTADEVQVYANR